MSKYRIKVMPYEGQIYYMPQKKGLIFWQSLFYNHQLPSQPICYTEQNCREFIRVQQEYEIANKKRLEDLRKFQKTHSTRIIEISDIA
jgi:hypothetical protein